ncbi:lycopene cyclase domain-containing protein [candidate division KSB1 bacterium]|nr:lycopene cyclase domain-containing protein [candidate division KSB1 bacterium]
MKSEYLIFNMLVIMGPLLLSFEKNVQYYKKWKFVFQAISIPMSLFILWDILVTGRHWWFNDTFTMGIKLFALPIEEWLFFITVPFSSLFVWEVLAFHFKNKRLNRTHWLSKISLIFIPIGLAVFWWGMEYTALVLIAVGLTGFLDLFLKIGIFRQKRTFQFLTLVTGLMLLFNGYLTWRPVVLYDPHFQLDIRILTIPIEDFLYGASYLLMCTLFYEKLKQRKAG